MMLLCVLCSMLYCVRCCLGQFSARTIHRFNLRFGGILFFLLCTIVAMLCVLLLFGVQREEETVLKMYKLIAVCVVIKLMSKFMVGCYCP